MKRIIRKTRKARTWMFRGALVGVVIAAVEMVTAVIQFNNLGFSLGPVQIAWLGAVLALSWAVYGAVTALAAYLVRATVVFAVARIR
jgi:hypothetical protein